MTSTAPQLTGPQRHAEWSQRVVANANARRQYIVRCHSHSRLLLIVCGRHARVVPRVHAKAVKPLKVVKPQNLAIMDTLAADSRKRSREDGSDRPTRLFLVRHAERQDHRFPEWATHAARPHDSPLSEEGFEQARLAEPLVHPALSETFARAAVAPAK